MDDATREFLGVAAEKAPKGKPAKSVIMLWMAGGPSQLETFDPHPNQLIAYDTKAIRTSALRNPDRRGTSPHGGSDE